MNKKFFAGGLILSVILLTGCTKQYQTSVKINKNDIVTEKNGNNTNIRHKKDPFYLLEHFITTDNKEERKILLKTMMKNPGKSIPVYYIIVSEALFPKDNDEAAVLYLYGIYRSMQDSACCTDKTSAAFVRGLPLYAPTVTKYINDADPEKYEKLVDKVFQIDEKFPPEISPIWACYHGMSTFNRDTITTIPQSEWAKQRSMVKEVYKKSVEAQKSANKN